MLMKLPNDSQAAVLPVIQTTAPLYEYITQEGAEQYRRHVLTPEYLAPDGTPEAVFQHEGQWRRVRFPVGDLLRGTPVLSMVLVPEQPSPDDLLTLKRWLAQGEGHSPIPEASSATKPEFLTYVDGTDGYCGYGDSPTPALALARELHAGMGTWDGPCEITVGRTLSNVLTCHAQQLLARKYPGRDMILHALELALAQMNATIAATTDIEGEPCVEYRTFTRDEYQPIFDALKAGQSPEEAAKALPLFNHDTYEFRQVHRVAWDRGE